MADQSATVHVAGLDSDLPVHFVDYPDAFMTLFNLSCPSHYSSTLSDIAKSSIKSYLILGWSKGRKKTRAAPNFFKVEWFYSLELNFGAAVMEFSWKRNVCGPQSAETFVYISERGVGRSGLKVFTTHLHSAELVRRWLASRPQWEKRLKTRVFAFRAISYSVVYVFRPGCSRNWRPSTKEPHTVQLKATVINESGPTVSSEFMH